jgi:protein involved in polysaccharide export with SLBB domain
VLVFTVGGQVRGPGQKSWIEGMTLYSAVQAAGGETPYGAINRVKVYRNGEVLTYNLNIAKDKNVKIYTNDLIDVPQKSWIGK